MILSQQHTIEQPPSDTLVMRMHGKMKSLESRYLDLANFYKRELLKQGGRPADRELIQDLLDEKTQLERELSEIAKPSPGLNDIVDAF